MLASLKNRDAARLGAASGPEGINGEGGWKRASVNVALDAAAKIQTFVPPSAALIVYRLGQEILNLQSGVRFPVGAPISEGVCGAHTDPTQKCPGNASGAFVLSPMTRAARASKQGFAALSQSGPHALNSTLRQFRRLAATIGADLQLTRSDRDDMLAARDRDVGCAKRDPLRRGVYSFRAAGVF